MSIKIIYQDDDLLVLDKSAGLVVDKSNTAQTGTLEDITQKEFKINLERGGIVHRLDKDTSGVILVAKTEAALENLQKQFQERVVKKEYLALVHGLVPEAGTVEGSIGRNPGNREKFIVLESGSPRFAGEAGKEAVTEYEPLQRLEISEKRLVEIFSGFSKIQFRKLYAIRYHNFTLVRAKPHTGRTHQIRVHLKYINHPIVSDEKYAGRKICRLDKRWCPRIFLHAAKIGFKHPESRKWMELESPLPEDLVLALSRLTT